MFFGENLYVTGCILALIVLLISFFVSRFYGSSVKDENFRKVGLEYDFWTGGYLEKEKTVKRYWFWEGIGRLIRLLLFILLSWITVIYILYRCAKVLYNGIFLPEKIKEIKFKLENRDLTKEEVKECLQELSIYTSGKKIDFRTDEEIHEEIMKESMPEVRSDLFGKSTDYRVDEEKVKKEKKT